MKVRGHRSSNFTPYLGRLLSVKAGMDYLLHWPPFFVLHLMLLSEASRPRRVIIPRPLDYSEIVERLQQAAVSDDEEDGDNRDEAEDEIKCVYIPRVGHTKRFSAVASMLVSVTLQEESPDPPAAAEENSKVQ